MATPRAAGAARLRLSGCQTLGNAPGSSGGGTEHADAAGLDTCSSFGGALRTCGNVGAGSGGWLVAYAVPAVAGEAAAGSAGTAGALDGSTHPGGSAAVLRSSRGTASCGGSVTEGACSTSSVAAAAAVQQQLHTTGSLRRRSSGSAQVAPAPISVVFVGPPPPPGERSIYDAWSDRKRYMILCLMAVASFCVSHPAAAPQPPPCSRAAAQHSPPRGGARAAGPARRALVLV